MLEKLYNLKCLNYSILIRKFYKQMGLDEKNCLIIITILDDYQEEGKIKVNDIATKSSYSITEVENTLSTLLEHDYLEIYLDLMPDGRQVEAYRLEPFFNALEKLILNNNEESDNDIARVISEIEKEIKRPLIPLELETVTSWFSDGYTLERISEVIKNLSEAQGVSVKGIERTLYKVKTKTTQGGNLKRAFEMIGKK